MKQGVYVTLLITIGIAIAAVVSIVSIAIDLALIKSDRAINNIKPQQTLDDLINGTITNKIIEEINTLAKQD